MLADVSNANDSDARKEAARWHARLQSRAISNADLDRFYAWRLDERNARAFAEVEGLWHDAASLADDPDLAGATDAIGRRHRSWRGWPLRIALPVALAAMVVLAVGLAFQKRPAVYHTEVGERLVVALDDGSRVTLDTATTLSVRYGAKGREVALETGQALFEVAHDPLRPFRVTADGTTVTALGTVFSVRRVDQGARVTLLKGRISVATPQAPPEKLDRPGETLDPALSGVRLGQADPAQATSWVAGRIDLRDTTLAEAIAEVNRYTRRHVVLDAPALAGTRVSGVFAADDPESFAAAVSGLLPLVSSTTSDGTIHLQERRR